MLTTTSSKPFLSSAKRFRILTLASIIRMIVLLASALGFITTSIVRAQTLLELPKGKAGTIYEYRFPLLGGHAPFSWSLIEGDLPPGLTLLPSGTIGGTLKVPDRPAYAFTVEVSDSSTPIQKVSQQCSLEIENVSPSTPLRIVSSPTMIIKTPNESTTSSFNSSDIPASGTINPVQSSQSVPKTVVWNFGSVKETNKTISGVAKPGVKRVSIEIAEEKKLCDPNPPPKIAPPTILKKDKKKKDKNNKEQENTTPTLKPCDPNSKSPTTELYVVHRILQPTLNNTTGEFAITLDQALTPGQRIRLIQQYADNDSGIISDWVAVQAADSKPTPPLDGEFRRIVLGFEQVGASSADSVQKPFLDFFVSNPVSSHGATRIWGDLRFTSVPQASTDLTALSSSIFAPALTGKINQLTQAVVLTSGIEIKLKDTPPLLGFNGNDKQKIRISFIAGGGFTTPLTPRDSLVELKLNDAARSFYNLPATKTIGAFVSPDRDRFLRQYFGGLRFSTFYYDKKGGSKNQPPATFDLTLGQNEAVTTRLQGAVLRLEGFYPLPFKDDKLVYLFGSGFLKLHRAVINNTPFILDPPSSPVSTSDPSVAILPTPQSNRDFYKIGVGVDLLELFKPKTTGNQATPSQ